MKSNLMNVCMYICRRERLHSDAASILPIESREAGGPVHGQLQSKGQPSKLDRKPYRLG